MKNIDDIIFILIYISVILSFIFISILAHADENQLPSKYYEAQAIIRKKKIIGKPMHGAWFLMFPPWGPDLDVAVRDRRDGKSGRSKNGQYAFMGTTSGEKSDAFNDSGKQVFEQILLATLPYCVPPPRDYVHEPRVSPLSFAEGTSQEFIVWATRKANEH